MQANKETRFVYQTNLVSLRDAFLRNMMRTACVMQTSSVMHAFGACVERIASYHSKAASLITYLQNNLIRGIIHLDKLEFVGEIMIILITGASHTGKTALAHKLLEKYKYPYLSIDHLKMGLIRSGNTELTPMSDNKDLTAYLWPIVREMVKTAIENKQNLIVEGCYIPFDWQKDVDAQYLESIKYYCLVMSEEYIRNHFADIKKYANVIENRLDDEWCTVESVLTDNAEVLALAKKHNVNFILIDDQYEINIDLD